MWLDPMNSRPISIFLDLSKYKFSLVYLWRETASFSAFCKLASHFACPKLT